MLYGAIDAVGAITEAALEGKHGLSLEICMTDLRQRVIRDGGLAGRRKGGGRRAGDRSAEAVQGLHPSLSQAPQAQSRFLRPCRAGSL